MTDARTVFDWQRQFQLALDPPGARQIFRRKQPGRRGATADHCTMCGANFCALRLSAGLRNAGRGKRQAAGQPRA